MYKRIFALAILALLSTCEQPAHAQNPTCPTRPVNDSSNACASTQFVLQNSGPINVRSYGATGNGTTDDSAAFIAAFTAACGTTGVSGAGRAVYIPAGFYRLSAKATAQCGLKVYGDGYPGDSGALLDNQVISATTTLNGSILLPDVGNDGLEFTSNLGVELSDFMVFYRTRPAAASGRIGIKIQAAATPTAPASFAWQEATSVRRVWVYGADINLAMVNAGQWQVEDSRFEMHASNGILIQGPNQPYVGSWRVGPNNLFRSGSVTSCQHVLATSSGGGHIHGNNFHSCGSNNVIPPLETSAIALIPILNVSNNSTEPVTISGNTMEGLSNCILFDGSTPSQNSSLTQFSIVGNQMWCVRPIDFRATSGGTAWISGGTITGNYMNAQTIGGGVLTATSNMSIAGATDVVVSSNTFSLTQANGGGDTSTPINLGTAATRVCQIGNKVVVGTGVSAVSGTIPLCMEGSSAGQIAVGQGTTSLALWRTMSGDCTLASTGVITCTGSATGVGDTNTTIVSTDRNVYTTASLTATRTWTMPLANSVLAGVTIRILDMFGGVSAANNIVLARAGADTINGNTSYGINNQFDIVEVTSDGTSKWNVSRATTGVAAAACGSATQTCVMTPDVFGRVKTATSTTMTALNGVSYPASYTSGGIPYASSASAISSSAALAANAVVLGGGAGTAPTTTGNATGTFANTGLNIRDTDASHSLNIVPGSNLTASRVFTLTTGDAARTLSMSGNITTAADFITSGANSLTLTTTGLTNVTLPTTGTLATLAGSETFTSKTLTSPNINGTVTATSLAFTGPTTSYTFTTTTTQQVIGMTGNQSLAYMNITGSGGSFFFGINGTTVLFQGSGASTIYSMESTGGALTSEVRAGAFVASLTTASTSSTTGAIKSAGGIAAAGAMWVGTYVATTSTTVGALPACGAGIKGARMFVSDSNAASYTAGIGAVVAAGGATNVPVVCDGTNWRIGANDNAPTRKAA